MIITELKGLTQILYFEGEYALIRAKDKKGMFRGVINRKGEIVWNVKWRRIVMRVHGFPNIFKTTNEAREFVYYDVEKHDFVEAPVIDESHKSKAQIMIDKASEISFFNHFPGFFSYKSLRYLSDDYVGFSSGIMTWGIKDLDGKIIFPEKFTTLGQGGEPNHFVVNNEDKNEGVINEKGQWVIPPIYSSLHWRRDYYVAYIKVPDRKHPKGGLLDKAGNILVPFVYDFLDPSYTEDLISVKKRGKFFFINSKNERIDLF